MIEFLFEAALLLPEYVLKYPGNVLLHLLGRDVDLDEESFLAYLVGTVLWLLVGLLTWLIIFRV